ncbi:MAG: DUF2892 domain-containing protein [Deltaproteobacteria bacterium]|nr:DUF2892 domain-containing protein [Deltaproteobacteria bacterium]
MIPATEGRVPLHTAPHVNEEIRRRSDESVARAAARGPRAIDDRLRELDREWDIERALEANAATVVLAGTALGAIVDRRFFAIPAVVGAFLLQHALQGWCPPVPVLRRLGFRTTAEIDRERERLEAIRGQDARIEDGGVGSAEPLVLQIPPGG